MKVELQEQVRKLEKDIRLKSAEAARISEENEIIRAEDGRLRETMNFRERNLGGWFGGDRNKVARVRELEMKSAELDSQASNLGQEAEKCENDLKVFIDAYLRNCDASYQSLVQPYDRAVEMKKAIAVFLEKIDIALSEIGDAQGMETIDLLSSNKGIAALSYMENSEASDAIDEVRAAVKIFQEAVIAYKDSSGGFQSSKIETEIGDGIDLVFDFALEGFDFMSIFTLSALGDAEDELSDVREKVNKFDEIFSDYFAKMEEAVTSYIRNVRVSCA
ncbi:MAG TPA: hypothetical protein DCX32_02095 [Candidatus Moranbacteria bacterium]|nr:MAG: hypothetical protein UW87_C0004G0030 [Candidatus Moranbacteria bacterium GW2011_GWC2_45_10]KKT95488.1 MAG: hypothetical protein UW95_C0001G0052 [Parcubacteria group bacterium GW2011_GWC1_45_14]HAV11311.1 hypothetical protein [Candidatus Moranbacteria bacterium]